MNWWKILSILLILYVIIAGLLAPLSAGVVNVSSDKVKTGSLLTLEAEGYNSHYAEAKTLNAWLKVDSTKYLCATDVTATDENNLTAKFAIPADFPGGEGVNTVDATLILDNEIDGISIFPTAIFINRSETIEDSATLHTNWNCELANIHENTSYKFPYRNILVETIRSLYFHVPMWFGMIFLFLAAVINSIKYLRTGVEDFDIKAVAYVRTGLLFGMIGIVTGMVWANYTWGKPWSFDIKQNMSAICLLTYFAYFVLRDSFEDEARKSRISAIYNIFAFAALIPLLFVIPRLTDSLHPGNGGNPAFGSEDLDNTMRTVFYPAVIGFTLLGFWITNLFIRVEKIKSRLRDDE